MCPKNCSAIKYLRPQQLSKSLIMPVLLKFADNIHWFEPKFGKIGERWFSWRYGTIKRKNLSLTREKNAYAWASISRKILSFRHNDISSGYNTVSLGHNITEKKRRNFLIEMKTGVFYHACLTLQLSMTLIYFLKNYDCNWKTSPQNQEKRKDYRQKLWNPSFWMFAKIIFLRSVH